MSPAGERWMGSLFAVGSACFLVGPAPVYVDLVGVTAVGVTFFVGSLFFTAGGLVQTALSRRAERTDRHGAAAFWAAAIQSVGTLFFNISTYRALHTVLTDPDYDRLVWRPDALGSICFLASATIAYLASSRRGPLPVRGHPGWWQPLVNLLGCVFFGVSALAGYVLPESESAVDLGVANLSTSLGAACFLACAAVPLRAPA